jgi:hypothetical protein
MVTSRDIATLRSLWKDPDSTFCSKYAVCYFDLDGNMFWGRNPQTFPLHGSQPLAREHCKKVKKALTGRIGSEIIHAQKKFEKAAFLKDALQSRLEDDRAMEELFQTIIDAFPGRKNPMEIMVYYVPYDVPGADGKDSEYVYNHMVVVVCDSKKQRAELTYNRGGDGLTVEQRVIKQPVTGFVYPAFENGMTASGMIIYNADPEHPNHKLYSELGAHDFKTTEEIHRTLEGLFDEYGSAKDEMLKELTKWLGDFNPFEVVTSIDSLRFTDSVNSGFDEKIAPYEPTAGQLIIPKYAAMHSQGVRRDRKRKLLMEAAEKLREIEGAGSRLVADLMEEADR